VTATVLAMVLLSALLHAAWSTAIKGSRDPMAFNVAQALVLGGLAVAGLAGFEPREVSGRVWGFLAATGACHGIYYYGMSRALERADLSLVYPVIRSTPAFLPLVAIPVFGEEISPLGALGIAVVVAGIWLVHTAPGRGLRAVLSPGLGWAWLTLGTTVGYSLFDKQAMLGLTGGRWSGAVPPSVALLCLLSLASEPIFLGLALPRLARGALRRVFCEAPGRLLGAVALSFAGYALILQAFASAPASYVVAVRQLSVLFAVLMAAGLLRERPGRSRMLGASATVIGVAIIAFAG